MTDKELKADKQPVAGFDSLIGREDSYMTSVNCQSPHGPSPLSIPRSKSKNDNVN
jgi:hypothetical protein